MKLWREIVSTAIVGTERQEFELPSSGDGELGRVLQSLKSDNSETGLLKSAAAISSYLRNGVTSLPDTEEQSSISPDEDRKFLSKRSENHLSVMLTGNYPQVLPEFLTFAGKANRVLPPQFLPETLDLGNKKRDLRQLVLPLLGARGQWLAHYNDAWNWALTEENPVEMWDTGTRDARILALEEIRRRNTTEARELLERDWQSESAKDRTAFLEVLRINLDKSDEAFLDKVLRTDKSTEVRRVAFSLLLKIHDSSVLQNIKEQARAILNFKPGGFLSKAKIEIELPNNFLTEEKDDLLSNLQFYLDEKKLGKKAVKIAKLFYCVPPKFWEETFSTKKETFIEAAVRQDDWADAILTGLKLSAVNFADYEWLTAVLPNVKQNEYYSLSNQITQDWTDTQIEKLIVMVLDGKLKSGVSLDFATQLFYHLKIVWSDDLTQKVLNILETPVSEKELQKLNGFIHSVLNAASLVSANYLKRFEEKPFQRLWENLSKLPGKARQIDEFMAVVQFRREMHTAFQNEE